MNGKFNSTPSNVSRQGDEDIYDVSHEAFIRNWHRYLRWQREAEQIDEALDEVIRNSSALTASEPPKPASSNRVWEWAIRAWEWISEAREERAASQVGDRARTEIGKVVGPNPRLPRRLVVALMADRVERLAGSPPEEAEISGTAQLSRETLENSMLSLLDRIKVPWALAVRRSERLAPRWLWAGTFLVVLLLAVFSLWVSMYWERGELMASADLARVQAIAALVQRAQALEIREGQPTQPLDWTAAELSAAYAKALDVIRSQSPDKGRVPVLAISSLDRAARELSGNVSVRLLTGSTDRAERAACQAASTDDIIATGQGLKEGDLASEAGQSGERVRDIGVKF